MKVALAHPKQRALQILQQALADERGHEDARNFPAVTPQYSSDELPAAPELTDIGQPPGAFRFHLPQLVKSRSSGWLNCVRQPLPRQDLAVDVPVLRS